MKILVVEDDQLIQRMYGRSLAQAGYTVVFANNGPEALDVATHERPDTILMDVMMPGMDGIEVLKELKANPATAPVPVIMLSANDDPELMQHALETGAVKYLTKSDVEPKQIVEFIGRTDSQKA